MRATSMLIVIAGCADPTASATSAIIGGEPAPDDTSTVLLASYPPARDRVETCSAVVVAPTILFTAAHCLDRATHPDFTFGVFLGADANPSPDVDTLEPHLVPVAELHPHPSFRPTSVFADLGAVILASPIDVAPVALQHAVLDDSIRGRTARIVGYGQRELDRPNASRNAAETTVVSLEGDQLVIGDATIHSCYGDSGGPAFVDGRLVGLASTGPDRCDGAGGYVRIDYHATFVDRFVPGPPRPDGPEMEPPPDDGSCTAAPGGGWLTALAVWACARAASACRGSRTASASRPDSRASSSSTSRRSSSTRS